MISLLWKYKFTLLLATLIVAGTLSMSNIIIPADSVKSSGSAKTSVSSEQIQRIIEMNGAEVKVTVETDTSFVTVSTNELLGIKLNLDISLWETEKIHRLNEVRTWLIKAGTSKFDLTEHKQDYVLTIKKPQISSREHITEDYTVKKRVGIWNPVLLKQLELKSRNKATQRAVYDGLLKEAQLSIENALYGILPINVKIKWE